MSVPGIETQTKTTRTTMYCKTNYHYFQPAIQLLKTCTRQPAHMEHTKYTTKKTNWYIQQTHSACTDEAPDACTDEAPPAVVAVAVAAAFGGTSGQKGPLG